LHYPFIFEGNFLPDKAKDFREGWRATTASRSVPDEAYDRTATMEGQYSATLPTEAPQDGVKDMPWLHKIVGLRLAIWLDQCLRPKQKVAKPRLPPQRP
jgi:hypothetical protein